MGTQEELERWDGRLAFVVGVAMVLIILGTIVGSGIMTWRLYQSGIPVPGQNPLSVIFSSRLMIGASHLAILCLGVFIVLSVLMHMRRGMWLTAAGPFKVSGSVARVSNLYMERDSQARLLLAENERLKATVSTLTKEARTVERLLEQAQSQLRKTED